MISQARSVQKYALGVVAAVLCGTAVGAAAAPRLWVVEYENDLFAGQDRYYSSGVRLSRIAETQQAPDWLAGLAHRFPGFVEGEPLPYGFSLNHNIFTPADITDPLFPPDDRPYAGWLNFQFATGTLQPRGADRLSVGLGIVGPAALGKQVQKWSHRLVGADQPRGWETQLKNEPTLQIGYDRMRRVLDLAEPERMGADVSVLGALMLGNAFTHAATGGFLRLGHNLPDDYGPPRISPAASGSGYFRTNGHPSLYVFIGVEGRRVVRNLFLEGNTIGGRDGVSARRNVLEMYAGVVYTRGRLRLAYSHVWRTREFTGQISSQDYGALSASLWW